MTVNISSRIEAYRDRFNPAFAAYFRRLRAGQGFPIQSRYCQETIDLLEDLSLRGGKRQRVAFLYESASLRGGEPPDFLEQLAISIELLHTHLLVHDDLVDDSPARRGGPSTYYELVGRYELQTSLGVTVFAGDLAAYLALAVLCDDDVPDRCLRELVRIQVAAGVDIFYGQILDLERDRLADHSRRTFAGHPLSCVQRDDGSWQVVNPGSDRASAVTDPQADAINRAREIVGNSGGGEVVIHGRDGRIRDSDTIAPGNDPNPPRDRK